MSAMNVPLAAGLAAVAAGAVAYVVLMPLLSGEKRADKRRQALNNPKAAVDRAAAVNRRDQVAKSLKDLDAKKDKTKVSLALKIERAGLSWSKQTFFVVSAVMGVALAFLLYVVTGEALAALAGAFVGGFGMPRWLLSHLKKRRIAKFINELPNAVDVIVRGIRSGIPLGDCLRMISREAQEPLRSEFKGVIDAQALGLSIGDSIGRLYERVPVSDVNFFGIVISIQEKAGGNLSEALSNLSRVLRDRRKMAGKVQAMSMEAKSSAAIIASLPFVVAGMTYITSPDYISRLWVTSIGQMCLVGSAIWMTIGILVMKKMINFEI